MKSYTVLVDALGFAGGCARKGELVTEEQIGAENVDRLTRDGMIQPEFVPEAPAKAPKAEPTPEPETVASRLSVGLPPADDHELTEEEIAWVLDVKGGIVPVPFDRDKASDLTVKEIKARIVGLGFEAPKDPKKAEAVEALNQAVVGYFEAWDVQSGEEGGSQAEGGGSEEEGGSEGEE